jgi:hypothetical protein
VSSALLRCTEVSPPTVESGDLRILPDLTDQDLEKLGVLLGHRRKLLRAIANLEGIEKGAPAVPVGRPAPFATPRAAESAERRHVTAMFSDLVGSTALSARMDPEDLREVISAYQKCVAETVQWGAARVQSDRQVFRQIPARYDASGTRKPLPHLTSKPTFACIATSDVVGRRQTHAAQQINFIIRSPRQLGRAAKLGC